MQRKKKFQFKVKNSGKDVWFITSIDDDCSWRLRARKLDNFEMSEVKRFVSVHTCALPLRQKDNQQVAPWVIGACSRRKYMSHNHNYLPMSIIEDISNDYSIKMSYHKAWRCKEKVLIYVRGSVKMSYQKLSSYLHMLQKKNLGTVTHFETNEILQFKHFFMALGVSIRGF